MKRVALLLAASGLFLGCQQAPKLTDYRFPRDMAEYRSLVESAPIVIVATIAADVPAAHPTKSHWEAEVEFQLQRLQLNVENVLRGDLKAGATVPVYYFMFHSTYNGPIPLGHWKTGDRKFSISVPMQASFAWLVMGGMLAPLRLGPVRTPISNLT